MGIPCSVGINSSYEMFKPSNDELFFLINAHFESDFSKCWDKGVFTALFHLKTLLSVLELRKAAVSGRNIFI